MKTILALIFLSMLSGCAAIKEHFAGKPKAMHPNATVIKLGIAESDSAAISNDMAQFLASQLPPAKTTLAVDRFKNPFHLKLRYALALRGFGIVNAEVPVPAVWVRYYVTDMRGGYLVRLRYDNKIASRFYSRSADGSLSRFSRFTVSEGKS